MTFTMHVPPGLPPYGEPAIGFKNTGKAVLYSEGFVVEFIIDEKDSWIGNFARGLSKYDLAVMHPDQEHALIIAGGHAYIIDPPTKTLLSTFGGGIVDIFPHPSRPWLIINHQNISFDAIGPSGHIWGSKRVSWDGIRSSYLEDEYLIGEAWKPENIWVPFKINLNSGVLEGGSYPEELIPLADKRAVTILNEAMKLRSSKKE